MVYFRFGRGPTSVLIYTQDLADKLARDCRSIMMRPWYRQIFRTRLAAHRNAVQEFITTTSLSCSAGSQRPPSSAANCNPLRPCTPPGRWNGSPRRTKLAEPLRRSATAIHRRQPRRAIKELHRWRPDRAIAASERALRLPDHTPLASRPVAIVEPQEPPAYLPACHLEGSRQARLPAR